jgi:xanthine dehydrogenase accessory factor
MYKSGWSAPEPVFRRRLRDSFHSDKPAAVATIVDVRGSAYRRPGAKMLYHGSGATGAITAGCLEHELADTSGRVCSVGEPELVTYDLTSDEDNSWGLGVGCEGVVTVLLEPVAQRYSPVIEAFSSRQPIAAITVVNDETETLEPGSRAYYHPKNERFVSWDGDSSDWDRRALLSQIEALISQGQTAVKTIERNTQPLHVFVDRIEPLPQLVVFGSGRDVGPVVHAGSSAGFRVTVVGFRGGINLDAGLPDADRTLTTSPSQISDALTLSKRTYAVVMTHNFVDDCVTVDELLDLPVPYIGVMGPKERFERLIAELQLPPDTDLSRVYAPIGLDLGGGSPHQIAHSIVAEVLAVWNETTPDHLRSSSGPIHDRIDD